MLHLYIDESSALASLTIRTIMYCRSYAKVRNYYKKRLILPGTEVTRIPCIQARFLNATSGTISLIGLTDPRSYTARRCLFVTEIMITTL